MVFKSEPTTTGTTPSHQRIQNLQAVNPPRCLPKTSSHACINISSSFCCRTALDVDEELHADRVTKILSTEGARVPIPSHR